MTTAHNPHASLLLWHGGMPGLRPGDVLTGGHERRTHPGCPFCEARSNGRTLVVDGHPVDGPSARPDRLYLTSDRAYARFYASLWGRGDLYRVEPIGDLEVSVEDHAFPSWIAESATVLSAPERAVLMTMTQRRALLRRWKVGDERAAVERLGVGAAP